MAIPLLFLILIVFVTTMETKVQRKAPVINVILDQFLLVVIGTFLTLKEKIVLSTTSKTHYHHVNKHGLNYVVHDLARNGYYYTGC